MGGLFPEPLTCGENREPAGRHTLNIGSLPTSRRYSSNVVVSAHGGPLSRVLYHFPCRLYALVAVRRGLLLLEGLVDVEEVLDLVEERIGKVLEFLDRVPERIVGGDADDLGVGPLFVLHPEDA